jgi:hypothetical protein
MNNKDLVGKFLIIKDIKFSDYMKDKDGKIKVYNSFEEAMEICGMYEFEDALVVEIKHNYMENHHPEKNN